MKKHNKIPLVVQSNCLVGICTGLTINEHKFLRYILRKVYNKNDKKEGLKTYKFLISDVCKELGMCNTNAKGEILRYLKHLRDTSFQINTDTGKLVCTSWISSFKYDFVDREYDYRRYITVVLDGVLQPYLQDLNTSYGYIKYDLKDIVKMKSKHSVILFETLLKELKNRSKVTLNYSIRGFKEVLGLTANQYKRTNHLKEKVINLALGEINAYTKLNVSVDYKKRGVMIVGIILSVKRKKKKVI